MARRISGKSGTVPFGGRSREAEASQTSQTSPASREEITQVAYEFFERRGRIPGHDLEDWLEAERIVAERRRARGPR